MTANPESVSGAALLFLLAYLVIVILPLLFHPSD